MAKNVFNGWSVVPPAQCGKIIYNISELFEAHRKDLNVINTQGIGKYIRESFNIGLTRVIKTFEYYAEGLPQKCLNGGFKQNGIGKELGKDGLDQYLDTKTIPYISR